MKYNQLKCPDTCWILNYLKISDCEVTYYWTFTDVIDGEVQEDKTYKKTEILNEQNEFIAKFDHRIYKVNIKKGSVTRYE